VLGFVTSGGTFIFTAVSYLLVTSLPKLSRCRCRSKYAPFNN